MAQQATGAYTAAHAQEAERIAEPIPRVAARWCACAADAEAAITGDAGRGPGRRGRTPRLWRQHPLRQRVAAVTSPKKRPHRGRPPQAEAPQVEVRYRLVVSAEAWSPPSEDVSGWTVLAPTVPPEEWTETALLQADPEQHRTVEPGFRWIKNPAAISPVWRENPERIAA